MILCKNDLFVESINCVKNNWCHKWFDIGSEYRINECIKGPFATPKVVVPVPYMTKDKTTVSTKPVSCHCTKEIEKNENVCLKSGIPDPWEEYLILSSFHEKGQKKCDDYRKIDFDIIKKINDSYSMYFGQGIPDPWKKWLHFESLTENASFSDLRKDIKTYFAKLRSGPGSEMFETKKVCCSQCNKEFSTFDYKKELDKCNTESSDKYDTVTIIPMQLRTDNNRIPNEEEGKKANLKDKCIGTENAGTETEKVKNFKSYQMENDKNCCCYNKSYAKYLMCNAAKSRRSKIGRNTSANANVRNEKLINMLFNNEKPNFQHGKSHPLLSQTIKHEHKAHHSNRFLSDHSPPLGNCSCTSSINRLASYSFLKGCSCHCKGIPHEIHLQSMLPYFYNIPGPCLCFPHHFIGFERKSCDHSLELKLVCPKCEDKRKKKENLNKELLLIKNRRKKIKEIY